MRKKDRRHHTARPGGTRSNGKSRWPSGTARPCRPGGGPGQAERRAAPAAASFARFALSLASLCCWAVAFWPCWGQAAAFFYPGSRNRCLTQSTPLRGAILSLDRALFVLVFLLILALRRLGRLAARRYTVPLSETMKAADALAEGDLSARVPEEGSGEFRHFTRSFNRMAQALEIANRQRRELLADIAHELRTPLTVIQGNLEGLRDGVYEATPEQLGLVLDETQKLGRLVDDLRLLTLAEAGQLPLDLQVLDVPQLLVDVRDAFACQAREAGISLALDTPESLPPLVADPQRLGQVLGNLVTNALRHTPPGGEVTWASAAAVGAAPNRHPAVGRRYRRGHPCRGPARIFDRFWRGDPARSHGWWTGSGLGLAIAKSLVEAHGGRIWAESQVGQGTVSCLFPVLPNRESAGTQ